MNNRTQLNTIRFRQIIVTILALSALFVTKRTFAEIYFDARSPQMQFAATELNSALAARGEQLSITFAVDAAAELKPEGFTIIQETAGVKIIGKDAAGAMYGGLELAETIRSEGIAAAKSMQTNPHMQMRGVKFNIPLDVRSPSYTDVSDAGQNNIAEMWNMAFWKEYIDTLAKHRYNYISIWSMHPFPSLVKVPAYPDIALADVKRSKGPFKEYYSLRGIWDGAEFDEGNLETIKVMTIDEKISFWREVMAYGKSRNIDFYVITWNIFTYGINGKYGITDSPYNKTTIDYFRQSVKELILTYPDLAGIGVTAGENMYDKANLRQDSKGKDISIPVEDKGAWLVNTYAAGTLDALKEQPSRKFRFIHRQHEASTDMILKDMGDLIKHPNVDFIFSFKYANAHVYSATKQDKAEPFIPTIQGKVKTIWTLRNDDIYLFRWGAPDFVREFVKNIPMDVTQGYYYGHDGFVSGREFTQLDAESPRQLEVHKHWLQWMLWGRMAYDPDYSNERIAALLTARYPEVDGKKLLEAWQKASMVYPRVTGLHWGSQDFMWYIEGTRGYQYKFSQTDSGFHDVESFIKSPTHKYAGVQSIPNFVQGKVSTDLSPLALADLIEQDVESAFATAQSFGPVKNRELKLTLDDLNIICEMGRYYADKIRGSTYVALARTSKKQADKDKAVETLTQAAEHYKKYFRLVSANHVTTIWFNRLGTLNFEKQIVDALKDIEIAQKLELK